jgi:hypothetical protein
LYSHDQSDLKRLNQAAEAFGEELLNTAFARLPHFAEVYGIAESDFPLLVSNVFFRLAVHANATAFRLDGEDLGKRMMQVLKSAAKE